MCAACLLILLVLQWHLAGEHLEDCRLTAASGAGDGDDGAGGDLQRAGA